MSLGMRVISWSDDTPLAEYGYPTISLRIEDWPWLESFTFDPALPYLGQIRLTKDPAKAMTWPDQVSVHDYWTQINPAHPVRPWDGRPNRPLTALHMLVEALP
jgi:hypothetical protein